MKLNIIKTIKDIYTTIIQLLQVYFTFCPHNLYKIGTNIGNFALCGVGLGLIYSQQLFWICNGGIIILYWYKQSINIFVYYGFVSVLIFLIYQSISKSLYLLKYLNHPQFSPENHHVD